MTIDTRFCASPFCLGSDFILLDFQCLVHKQTNDNLKNMFRINWLDI